MLRFLGIALFGFKLLANEFAPAEILILEAKRLDIERRIRRDASLDELNSRRQLWNQVRTEAFTIFKFGGIGASIGYLSTLRIFNEGGPFFEPTLQKIDENRYLLLTYLKVHQKLFY